MEREEGGGGKRRQVVQREKGRETEERRKAEVMCIHVHVGDYTYVHDVIIEVLKAAIHITLSC